MNRTLSGKPAMTEARRNHIHGPLLGVDHPEGEPGLFTGTLFVLFPLALGLAVWAMMPA